MNTDMNHGASVGELISEGMDMLNGTYEAEVYEAIADGESPEQYAERALTDECYDGEYTMMEFI